MPAINQSALHKTRLLIGGQDFSAALLEISNWNTNSLDSTGLIKTTATITLIKVRGLPGSLDDRVNHLWRTGQTITIDVTNSAGTLQRHPRGSLRILSSEFSSDTGKLTVNAGCLITLMNFRQPTDAASAEIDAGTMTARSSIILKLLNKAGIAVVNNPYGSLGYPINYPIQINGNYLDAVGKLLYSAGYFAFTDRYEAFCIKPVNLNPSTSLNVVIGRDELWYKRLTSNEQPKEKVIVAGVAQVARLPQFPASSYSVTHGDAAIIDSSLSGTVIVNEELIDDDWSEGTRTRTTETTINQPIGLSLPNMYYAAPSMRLGIIPAQVRREVRRYQSPGPVPHPNSNQVQEKEGKLIRLVSQIRKPIGGVLSEYYKFKVDELIAGGMPEASAWGSFSGLQNLFSAERIEVDYAYDNKKRPLSVTTRKYETEGALLSGIDFDWSFYSGSPPIALRLSEVLVESWAERPSLNQWSHFFRGQKTLGRIKPQALQEEESTSVAVAPLTPREIASRMRNKALRMVTDDSQPARETSNSGQTVPPAPERHPPKAGFEGKQVKGHAIFSQHGGNPYRDREITYQAEYLQGTSAMLTPGNELDDVPTPAAIAQCEKLAQIEGKLLYGRSKGQDIGLDLLDPFFDWEPLQKLVAVEPDGTTQAFLMDDSHWIIQSQKALCNFGCIWLNNSFNPVNNTTSNPALLVSNSAVVGNNFLLGNTAPASNNAVSNSGLLGNDSLINN